MKKELLLNALFLAFSLLLFKGVLFLIYVFN